MIDARDYWKAYQIGQGSADHTAREVFCEVVQPLLDQLDLLTVEHENMNEANVRYEKKLERLIPENKKLLKIKRAAIALRDDLLIRAEIGTHDGDHSVQVSAGVWMKFCNLLDNYEKPDGNSEAVRACLAISQRWADGELEGDLEASFMCQIHEICKAAVE